MDAMNPVHLHLMLNHIPLVGVGFVILLLIIALLRRSSELINVSLIFVILAALWAIPAHRTGESAEEYVEEMPSVSQQLVESHDKSADIAFIFIEAVGALALITLVCRRYYTKLGNALTAMTLLGLIVSGGLLTWAAYNGGKISHPELRGDRNGVTIPKYKSTEEENH